MQIGKCLRNFVSYWDYYASCIHLHPVFVLS